MIKRPKWFYKYTTCKTLKTILRTQTVRYSSPIVFNDMFDSQLDLCVGNLFDNRSWKNYLYREIKSFAGGLEKKIDIRKRIKDRFQDAKNELVKTNKRWKQYIRYLRVFCVSETYEDLVMWAQYADSSLGAVIKFRNRPRNFLSSTISIDYWPNFPLMSLDHVECIKYILGNDDFGFDKHFFQYAFIKSDHWKREREWRSFETDNNLNDKYVYKNIDPLDLESIILGTRCTSYNKSRIKNMLTDRFKHVKLYQAKKRDKSFGIELNQLQ